MEAVMRAPAVVAPSQAIEWGFAGRALAGQPLSGDLHVVVATTTGAVVAVVDGLGHGSEAAAAAEIAGETVRAFADESVDSILRRCHAALRRTRGAAISIASFDTSEAAMTWSGIGNVEGLLIRGRPDMRPPREALLLRGGVVGYSLPPPRCDTLPIAPGDTLIFTTDGVGNGYRRAPPGRGDVRELAVEVLSHHGRDYDDALVLVARYIGFS